MQPWPRYTNTSELNLRLRVDKGAPNITVQVPSSSHCQLPPSSMKREGHNRVWNSRSELLLLACHVKHVLQRTRRVWRGFVGAAQLSSGCTKRSSLERQYQSADSACAS